MSVYICLSKRQWQLWDSFYWGFC